MAEFDFSQGDETINRFSTYFLRQLPASNTRAAFDSGRKQLYRRRASSISICELGILFFSMLLLGLTSPTQAAGMHAGAPALNASGVPAVIPIADRIEVFERPTMSGRRLDWCLRWGADCGKQAADAFCVANGFDDAAEFEIEADIGLTSPTQVLASGEVCSDQFCDGFLRIACRQRNAGTVDMPQGVELWRLTKREYPVLPEFELHTEFGRNAGSFIKLDRVSPRNTVAYIHSGVAHGEQECLAVSTYKWSDNEMPAQIATGTEVYIELDAGVDRMQGSGCGFGRIGVAYGSRAEPLDDTALDIDIVSQLQAIPLQGSGPARTTNIFRVNTSRAGNDLFTVAIYITDGGTVRRVVALYVYEKVRRFK